MVKETQIETVKSIAKSIAMIPIFETKYSPMIVSHPFTNSGVVMIRNGNGFEFKDITKDKNFLNEWQRNVFEQIDNIKSARQLFYFVNRAYSLFVFSQICDYLSDRDFSSILGAVWINSEFTNMDANVPKQTLLKLFKKANKSFLMTEKEINALADFNHTAIIYRGVTDFNKRNIKALSWTTSYSEAKWFAERFHSKGKVYSATIQKEDILAYFESKNEDEVVVDYTKLKNIKLAKEPVYFTSENPYM